MERRSIYLSLGNKDGDILLLARRQSKVLDALDSQLVPDSAEVGGLVKLNLVGDATRAQLLVLGVLQVPSRLVLLHKLTNNGALAASTRIVVNRLPDLQVLGCVAIFVL